MYIVNCRKYGNNKLCIFIHICINQNVELTKDNLYLTI